MGTLSARRDAWLSLTPEPERELPAAIATLRSGRAAADAEVAEERRRLERLVVRGRQRPWLAYLRRALGLAQHDEHARPDPELERARQLVLEVLHNHHQLLLGVPGRGAERTAGERARLESELGRKGAR